LPRHLTARIANDWNFEILEIGVGGNNSQASIASA
jgi:hypothetical protein